MNKLANDVKGLVDDCVVSFKYGAKILRSKGFSRSGSKSKNTLTLLGALLHTVSILSDT